MDSREIVSQFFREIELDENFVYTLEDQISSLTSLYGDRDDLTYDYSLCVSVLADTFNINAQRVKTIAERALTAGVNLNRASKSDIKAFLDYRDQSILEKIRNRIPKTDETAISELILDIQESANINPDSVAQFIAWWSKASEEANQKKLDSYCVSLLTRLHIRLNQSELSLSQLFDINQPIIDKELSQASREKLNEEIKREISSDDLGDSATPAEMFNKIYESVLLDDLQIASRNGTLEAIMNSPDGSRENSLAESDMQSLDSSDFSRYPAESISHINITINQPLADSLATREALFDYAFDAVKRAYRILKNNSTISILIDSIILENRELKWELYGYLSVYMERFIETREHRLFFSPAKLALENQTTYGFEPLPEIDETTLLSKLTDYYKGAASVESLLQVYNVKNRDKQKLGDFLDRWRTVFYGYTFSDAYIIDYSSAPAKKVIELATVEDKTNILLTFYKYRMDERKRPCPICAGLTVSGNSYSEIGHRSWECKNSFCPGRSKSNRGKRYSAKSAEMQRAFLQQVSDDLITKEQLVQWRKDVVTLKSVDDVYSMVTKFFSYTNEYVLFLNPSQSASNITKKCNRLGISYNYTKDTVFSYEKGLFEKFRKGEYLTRILGADRKLNSNIKQPKTIPVAPKDTALATVIRGNCLNALRALPRETIKNMVTSPPYFNAREYSQWPNYYLYMIDMYDIIRASFDAQKAGGIYLWNIGDIAGNEATIAKSNMGNKRLLLGAYSIIMFLETGYQIVANFIWDKGEPQSKRNANDGKMTPHYQKPINAYEHMLLFVKPGARISINSLIWDKSVVRFPPVIKINSKGENILKHTAPYPSDISDFVVKGFSTSAEDITLDPFLGSGTTCISGINHNVKTIGIELDQTYAELAAERIKSHGSCEVIEL